MTIDPVWGHVAGVFTLMTMLSFLGIWAWVWQSRHKPKYDELARLPMNDEESP